jgi:hypothetical protein
MTVTLEIQTRMHGGMMLCNSYVAIDRTTGIAVWEFYGRSIIKKIDRKRFAVMSSYHYLIQFNRSVKSCT